MNEMSDQEFRESELSELMRSMPCSAPAEAFNTTTLDDNLLIDELVFEESKVEDEVTDEESAKFGKLSKLYPIRLLRAYW